MSRHKNTHKYNRRSMGEYETSSKDKTRIEGSNFGKLVPFLFFLKDFQIGICFTCDGYGLEVSYLVLSTAILLKLTLISTNFKKKCCSS